MPHHSDIKTIITAVSGGVDSVVMLHLLASSEQQYAKCNMQNVEERSASCRLVVAHVDHGMRPDSAADARFTEMLADYYRLPFELGQLRLGEGASEERARRGRHHYLRSLSKTYDGALIATAHHQSDLLETAIINLLRGTGRHGLSSLKTTDRYIRPLLDWDRQQIYDYAIRHRLEWVEDKTNDTDRFLRNRIRHHLSPQLRRSGSDQKLLVLIDWFATHNPEIDRCIDSVLETVTEVTADHVALHRTALNRLPDTVQLALVHRLLRRLGVHVLDKQLVEAVVAFAHTAQPGKRFVQATPLRVVQTPKWTLFQTVVIAAPKQQDVF